MRPRTEVTTRGLPTDPAGRHVDDHAVEAGVGHHHVRAAGQEQDRLAGRVRLGHREMSACSESASTQRRAGPPTRSVV
jgi:hypothetical protein